LINYGLHESLYIREGEWGEFLERYRQSVAEFQSNVAKKTE
jgi:hypothetical protein